jgi:hypothetical protein
MRVLRIIQVLALAAIYATSSESEAATETGRVRSGERVYYLERYEAQGRFEIPLLPGTYSLQTRSVSAVRGRVRHGS